MEGWIKLHRSIKKHWIFQDPEKFRAWMIILLEVNHDDSKVNIGNLLLNCKRGESLKSLDTWAKIFGNNWNKSKVRRFFDLLKNDSMIELKNERKTTRLTVCKYETYQDKRNENETKVTRKRHANDTQTTPNKNEKNEKNISFDEFWNLYNKKVGDKNKAEKKWKSLNNEQREKIIKTLPNFISRFKDKQFQPYPTTYLNQERWNDEIESTTSYIKPKMVY